MNPTPHAVLHAERLLTDSDQIQSVVTVIRYRQRGTMSDEHTYAVLYSPAPAHEIMGLLAIGAHQVNRDLGPE